MGCWVREFRSLAGWGGVGLYKILLFGFIILLLLAVDGTLTYDILEFKIDTAFDWLVLITILGLAGGIYFADQDKKGKD